MSGEVAAALDRTLAQVEQGYRGFPTIVNNVGTFCAAGHMAFQSGA